MWEGMHRYIGSCRKVGFPVAGDTGSCEPSMTQVPVTKLESAGKAAMLRGAEPSLQALLTFIQHFASELWFPMWQPGATWLENLWLVLKVPTDTRQNSNWAWDLPTTLVSKAVTPLSHSVGFVWLNQPSARHGVTARDRCENVLTLMSSYILICNGWLLKSTSPVCRIGFPQQTVSQTVWVKQSVVVVVVVFNELFWCGEPNNQEIVSVQESQVVLSKDRRMGSQQTVWLYCFYLRRSLTVWPKVAPDWPTSTSQVLGF